MREIKFRGKSITGIWYYGYLTIDAYEYYFIESLGGTHLYSNKVIPETVGQFTGLQDKNEVDIYEGDKILYDGITGIIHFNNGSYYVNFEYTRSAHLLGELERDIEVIGNIHDNPELLN